MPAEVNVSTSVAQLLDYRSIVFGVGTSIELIQHPKEQLLAWDALEHVFIYLFI